MARRTSKRRTIKVPIHVNLPLSLLEQIDEVALNRSGFIKKACEAQVHGDVETVTMASTRQLMAALAARDDVDDTLSKLLIVMLSN